MIRNGNILLAISVVLLFAVFGTIFLFGNEREREATVVGFVITGTRDEPGWNGRLCEAMEKVAGEMGLKLLIKENIRENTGQCPVAIRELADAGARLIFLTSYGYPEEAKDVVTDYPRVAFATIAAKYTAKNMAANFARLYQGRYLSGIIAGMRTQSNVIGYVAAMENSEVNRGINAFALGVQRVNPEARVLVSFTGSWQDDAKEAENARRLVKEAGADVLTYHQNQRAVADACEEMGVDFIGYHEPLTGCSSHYLTSVVCRWEAYYTDIVQRYLKGELCREHVHWMGIEKDAVFLSPYSDRVTEPMRKQVELARQEILDGFLVFSGEIYDNQGNLRCKRGDSLSDDILLEYVNWLAKGVEVLK